jgi:hypothetical protein
MLKQRDLSRPKRRYLQVPEYHQRQEHSILIYKISLSVLYAVNRSLSLGREVVGGCV